MEAFARELRERKPQKYPWAFFLLVNHEKYLWKLQTQCLWTQTLAREFSEKSARELLQESEIRGDWIFTEKNSRWTGQVEKVVFFGNLLLVSQVKVGQVRYELEKERYW